MEKSIYRNLSVIFIFIIFIAAFCTLSAVNASAYTTKASNDIQLITINTGKEKIPAKKVVLNGLTGYSQEIKGLKKGVVWLKVQSATSNPNNSCSFGIYKDQTLSTKIGGTIYTRKGESSSVEVVIPDAGTYYIGFQANGVNSNFSFNVQAAYVNNADRTLINGKTMAVGMPRLTSQTNYFKFKAPYTGYVTLNTSTYTNACLLDQNKKILSHGEFGKKTTFAMAKGKTYFVRVDGNAGNGFFYTMKGTLNKISEKSGKKKSKASSLAKKKLYKGTITESDRSTDWYKVKISKGEVNLKISSTVRYGHLKMDVYNAKGKRILKKTFGRYNLPDNGYSVLTGITSKLRKGTYYIKFYPENKKSAAWYSLSYR